MILRNDPEHDGSEVNFVGSLYEFYISSIEHILLLGT